MAAKPAQPRTLRVTGSWAGIDGAKVTAVQIRQNGIESAYFVRAASDDMGAVATWKRADGYGEYEVTCNPLGLATRCTCPAGKWGRGCKHKAATEVLVAREVL